MSEYAIVEVPVAYVQPSIARDRWRVAGMVDTEHQINPHFVHPHTPPHPSTYPSPPPAHPPPLAPPAPPLPHTHKHQPPLSPSIRHTHTHTSLDIWKSVSSSCWRRMSLDIAIDIFGCHKLRSSSKAYPVHLTNQMSQSSGDRSRSVSICQGAHVDETKVCQTNKSICKKRMSSFQ